MQLMHWQHLATSVIIATAGSTVFWIIARLAILARDHLPGRRPFAADLLAAGGDRERLQYQALGRRLAVLLAAILAGALVGFASWLLQPALDWPDISPWLWMPGTAAALALFAVAIFFTWRLSRQRRDVQFAWAAKSAIGNILKRLNLAGNSVFHDVASGTAIIDHVVVGRKGVFALNVVARPVPRRAGGRATAELKNGKLRMGDTVEALPVGDAARNMTVLAGALTRIVGHRVPVRSVLVVPGWDTIPSNAGNHLVLNERNLAMLTSWNTPDAFLMDEDCVAIHAFLHEASRTGK